MYLAIDLGSTSFKAAIFSSEMRRIGAGEGQVEHIYPDAGQVELPVENAVSAFREAVSNAIANAKISPDLITAIAITSQAQTFTIMNVETGECEIPFRSWQDERSTAVCQQVKNSPPWNNFIDNSGVSRLLPSLQPAMLLHMTRVEGMKISANDRLMPLPSYIVYLLSGCYVTDNNIASMSGLYSMKTGTWWRDAVAECGLDIDNMPRLLNIGDIAGETGGNAIEFGLPAGIPIILAGNDQTAGAYGAEMPAGGVLATLGTALVAYKVQDDMPVFIADDFALRGPYPGGNYYLLTTDNNCGNVINWAIQVLGYGDDYQDFFNTAFSAPVGSKGLEFTPDLSSACGSWQKISFNHTRADMARSVLESLSERTSKLINQLRTDKSLPVYLAGGCIKSAGWVKMLAETINTEVIPVQADPLLGAAKMICIEERREKL
jgi:xylulokinase